MLIMVMSAVLLSACHEDIDVVSSVQGPVTLDVTELDAGSDGRYYIVTATTADGTSPSDIRVASTADWIKPDADTLMASGSLAFYVTPNDGRRREGTLLFTRDGNGPPTTLIIRQRSQAEDADNALPGGQLTRMARVGYGYNMLIDYNDPKSVTDPILDYQKMVAAERSWGTLIAEEGRARQNLMTYSSYSLEEMSSWMTTQSSTETNLLFYNKSVQKFKKVTSYNAGNLTYGFSSLRKVVASRYIDEGKIASIIRQGGDIFTDDFREIYDQVNSAPSAENVTRLIKSFGTHLVTYTDLGGRLEYSVNFKSEETSRQTVEKYLQYKNGMQTKSSSSEEASHSIITTGNGLAFDIYGGSEAATDALRAAATTKDSYGQVSAALLGEWLNSIRADEPSSLSLVKCMLMPVWQLFTNPSARTAIINTILDLATTQGTDIGLRRQELGLDNYYRLDLTDAMLHWDSGSDNTLVRLIYFDGQPKVEVCNEYVPQLRGDRRVTIFYPIYKQQTNIRRGIFPGDGENAPAEVTFDAEGGCYINPLEGFMPGDRLKVLYYIDGAFYPKSFGIEMPSAPAVTREATLSIPGHAQPYPIVKIGCGYWTRFNLTAQMGFGVYDGKKDQFTGEYYEDIRNNGTRDVLYADVFYPLNPYYTSAADFGTDEGLWFLPTIDDMDALLNYLGNNTKALFKNQQTGFEATFDGCYSDRDLIASPDVASGFYTYRYSNEKCLIAFKNSRAGTASGGSAICLSPDYSLKVIDIRATMAAQYTVRPFRDNKYKYPLASSLSKKQP